MTVSARYHHEYRTPEPVGKVPCITRKCATSTGSTVWDGGKLSNMVQAECARVKGDLVLRYGHTYTGDTATVQSECPCARPDM